MGLGATTTANWVHLPLRQPSPKYAEARFPLDLSTHAPSRNTTILSKTSPAYQSSIATTVIMVADAVIYHPTVAHYLRFVATTGTPCPLLHSTPSQPQPHPSSPFPSPQANPTPFLQQSAATNSSARSNTSPASTPGTCCARTRSPAPSPPSTPSRSSSA